MRPISEPRLTWTYQGSSEVKECKVQSFHGYYTAIISAKLSGIKVNQIFYRKGKNGNWNALLTSDLKLDARKYSDFTQEDGLLNWPTKRWSRIWDSERISAGTLPDRTLVYHFVFQYNILSYVKSNESYETIGGLFVEITRNSVELSVAERIWLLIVEVINVIAETLKCDTMVFTEQVISNDKQIKAVKQDLTNWWPLPDEQKFTCET